MPPACWGSQSRSGRSPRSSSRFTLQFRRPEHPGLPSDAATQRKSRKRAVPCHGTVRHPRPGQANPAEVTLQSARGVDGLRTTAAAIGRAGGDERGRGLRVEVFLGLEFRGYFADIRVAEVSPLESWSSCKNTSPYFTGAICNSWPSVAK